jgi:hypothetical protein
MSALSEARGGQRIASSSWIVYVDNDPVAHAHTNALLTGVGSDFNPKSRPEKDRGVRGHRREELTVPDGSRPRSS